ncbi:multiubiquitin domain-containing protein [Amycolatopsis sp. NPDC024027]|uniref:multiubiquitin domain-containing protein n=1 Tax=Amycolatopsis sp. NPDC024027 TaxID=3154327 RepID=UPI0033F2A36F
MPATHTGADIDDTPGRHPGEQRAKFVFDVDGTTYEYKHPTITGAEIMAIAGISSSDGLIQILPDGTRKTVAPDETVHLVPGAQFKRRPRFKRG